jgi:hypothetical protein
VGATLPLGATDEAGVEVTAADGLDVPPPPVVQAPTTRQTTASARILVHGRI